MAPQLQETQLRPTGELDIDTAGAAFDPYLAHAASHLAVDLSAVTFLDAFTLGRIVNLRNATIERGGQMRLTGATERTTRIFEITGLVALLEKSKMAT